MGSFIAVFWAMTLPWVQGSSSQCKSQGLSLLAHRTGRKSRYCPMHFECMWWNSPYLLQSNSTTDVESLENTNTALGDISCATGGCGDQLPKGPEACMDFFGGCTPPFQGGNCFYATAQMKTLDGEDCAGCGYYVCHCKNLSQDRCTEESLGWDYTLLSRSTLFMEKSWELVGGEGNHACRGDNSTDNRATLYTVYNKIYSLYGCKKMCEKRWPTACHGIEYSYGRCEIWVRHGGLFAYQEIPREKGNYTCMRYGWPTSKLVPLDPSGETLHPCRASGGRNHPSFYTLAHKATPTSYRDIEECKAACSNAWFCTGIEWSLGRCEIWTVLIESFERNVNGYHCLRMIP